MMLFVIVQQPAAQIVQQPVGQFALSPDRRGAKECGACFSESTSLAPLHHLGGDAGGEDVLRKENQA
jgi:hypothetical protein